MKRALFALVGAALLTFSTGCGICDNLFFFHKPYGGCGNGCGGGCDGGGCANGNCADGNCADGNFGDRGGAGVLGHHSPTPRGVGGEYVGPQGPPTGAVAYPYYANRGPRDFLLANPPSIGP